jgi:hypothetical protein
MWCQSVVNRNPLSSRAFCRMRSCVLGRSEVRLQAFPPWLCRWFPSLCPFRGGHTASFSDAVLRTCFAKTYSLRPDSLPSTPSADHGATPVFVQGLQLSDFLDRALPSCFIEFTARTTMTSVVASHRISRFPCEKLACVRRVLDHARSEYLSRLRGIPCCLPLPLMRRHPGGGSFRGSIPGPHAPCQRFTAALTDDCA